MSLSRVPERQELSNPVPTRFLPEERQALEEAARDTGYSTSEVIRRAVRLVKREKCPQRGFKFLVDLNPTSSAHAV